MTHTRFDLSPMSVSIQGIPLTIEDVIQEIIREEVSDYVQPVQRLEAFADGIGSGIASALRDNLAPPVEFNVTLPYRRVSVQVLRVRLSMDLQPTEQLHVQLVSRDFPRASVPQELMLRQAA